MGKNKIKFLINKNYGIHNSMVNKTKELSEMSLEELWELFPIKLSKPSMDWENWFNEEYKIIKSFFPKKQYVISHIGSTAIKGICAKPTIDILIEIPKSVSMDDVKKILVENGYTCMSEKTNRKSFNKGYTKYGYEEKVFHLHLRYLGDNDELYFRDFLNDFPDVAKKYEKLKLSLWKKFEHNRDAYTDAKTEFINNITLKAKKLYNNKYKI